MPSSCMHVRLATLLESVAAAVRTKRTMASPAVRLLLLVSALVGVKAAPPPDGCPAPCECRGSSVYCMWAGLTSVPAGIPPGTTILRLNNNQISNLPPNAFANLPNLRGLDLSRNKLTNVSAEVFKSLTNLEWLYLSNNEIQYIAPNAFLQQRHLKDLFLQANNLMEIPSGALQSLGSLTLLDLSENGIKNLTNAAFTGLVRLQTLYLSANCFSHIENGAFSSVANLEKLYINKGCLMSVPIKAFQNLKNLLTLELGVNDIRVLAEESFFGMGRLKRLRLSNNKIAQMSAAAFGGLKELRYLDLKANRLTELLDGTFRATPSLEELYLCMNNITEVKGTAFQNVPGLQMLKLDDNAIQTFPAATVASLSNLQSLDLSGNPLKCDCFLRPLRKWLDDASAELAMREQTTCTTPVEFLGARVDVIPPENFTCPGGDPPGYGLQDQVNPKAASTPTTRQMTSSTPRDVNPNWNSKFSHSADSSTELENLSGMQAEESKEIELGQELREEMKVQMDEMKGVLGSVLEKLSALEDTVAACAQPSRTVVLKGLRVEFDEVAEN
ncbi:chondroadherin-like [Branchiostoma floridae]|uniref:Chondroadherin-like n=1 Tax=Branchiostoma floridae TaxID=7739 RepID=A0A9J7LW75_BRAFL|nr:chondroadherin-like [Branchiostoma floridae]